MLLFESPVTVSYSHSIATVAVSLAVSIQYTNVIDLQTDRYHTTAKTALIIFPLMIFLFCFLSTLFSSS